MDAQNMQLALRGPCVKGDRRVTTGVIGNQLLDAQFGCVQEALTMRRQRASTLVEEHCLL